MIKTIIYLSIPLIFSNDLIENNALNGDQVITTFNKDEKIQHIPEDQVVSDIRIKKTEAELDKLGISDPTLRSNILNSQQFFTDVKKGNIQPPAEVNEIKAKQSAPKRAPEVKVITLKPKKIVQNRFKRKKKVKTSSIQVFSNPSRVTTTPISITLPSASLTPATLMAGVEVSTEKRLVDVEINYAFIGPNGAVVDMKDCHTWLEVSGNYNTERIYGTTKSISCRAPNGKTFNIPLKGQLRDAKDEYIGVKAELVTRGKIAASALQFLQSGTSMFGEAISAAQVSTEVLSGNDYSASQKAQNISGDQSKYIVGKSIAGATGNFLDWWIEYYKGLSPTLAIAPGTKVYLSIQDEIQIPTEFFKDLENKDSGRSNTTITLTKKEQE